MDIIEAARVMRSGLGRAEGEFASSITAPIYWADRAQIDKGPIANGTVTFLDCGKGPFAVTAAHVLLDQKSGALSLKSAGVDLVTQVGNLVVDIRARLIDFDAAVDLATMHFEEREIRGLGAAILQGHQKSWPPAPPMRDRGVVFAGFPGIERKSSRRLNVDFGAMFGSGVASSISDRNVSCLFERERWIDVLGLGLPPPEYPLGGLSGGPMLTVVEDKLRAYRLAGIIVQGPNKQAEESIDGFEVLRARRADFIKADGAIDRALWI